MSDVFDDEGDAEPTISIGDYLKTVEEEELEADLILGGDEGKECTYSKGYVKRQAIFSCLTCTPDGNAGVCTACSLVCHDGHEILELWTKRNFRCDCGNSKFGEFFCKLSASKDVENPENMYNHNFKGTYCACDLPYPDPNVEEQIEMIQCCICEDWFHEEHIGLQSGDKIPRDEEGEPLYEDFICQGCAVVCSFLTCYPQTISASDPSDTTKEKGVENSNLISSVKPDDGNCSFDSNISKTNSPTVPVDVDAEVAGPSTKCIVGGITDNLSSTENSKPLFLSKGWRECLCRCGKCCDLYAQRRIGFLVDKEDSIAEYERMGEQKRNENIEKQEGAEMSFLNNLGHVEKMEILSGIADMKNEIFSFLESSDRSKPITTADVQQGEMSDVFDDEADAEPTISFWDYLENVEDEELNTDMILGGDEGKKCTYSEGYVKRQEIFSCLTCSPDGNAGVCTACSLICHDGHEILELWTKRNFRCDCGNSKFGEFFCKLLTSKDVENPKNMYNHNFKGTYCTCDRPDPDPNVVEEIEMIQCCICEDWFHEEHIGLQSGDKIPRDEEGGPLYEDFICQGCAVICSFLTCYPQIMSASNPSDIAKEKAVENSTLISSDRLDDECREGAGPSMKCILLDNLPANEISKPLFLPNGWREWLCRCGQCWDLYAQRRIGFLIDKEDSLAEYERMADQKWNENVQKLEDSQFDFLNKIGHVEKMEVLSIIGDMKNEIFSFVESSDPSKPLTIADVRQLYENVLGKRKPLLKTHHNCRCSASF
ncbi:PHD finger protein-like protein [Perilla frutescens var. frutescens]|nr:PHD finger protein-like protein [Perilla frutescens var. frutescens]